MALAQQQDQIYTIEDIYNLPEGVRAELIDGQIYMMSSPSTAHQRLIMNISSIIHQHIKSKKGDCEVFPAPFAVFLNKDNETYLEPDISVICDPDKLDDKGCKGAPDWIIEITSPSNTSYDYVKKLNLYLDYGVREYWIVNPQSKSILVYFFELNILGKHYTFNDKIKVNIYDDLYIDFNELNI